MVIHSSNVWVTSRLPREWHGLFRNLNRSVQDAVRWFVDETSSEYGCHPIWHSLISAIVQNEPHIHEDLLVFKPRFLLLPSSTQNNFIEFLTCQACIIPDIYIQDFVLAIIQHTNTQSKLHNQLLHLANQSKNCDAWLQILHKVGSDDTSADIVTRSCEQFNGADMIQVAESSFTGSQECIIIDASDSHTERSLEPEPKRRKLEIENTLPDTIQSNDDVTVDSGSDQRDEQSGEITRDKPTELTDGEESDTVMSGKENLVARLKEVWQNCVKDCDVEGLTEVSQFSLKDIEEFCRLIDFDSMSDDSIELVCEHLCSLSDTLSYDSTVSILKYVLGNRIMQLSQNASRKLSGAVTLVCQKYPKHTVDSIFVPCMGNNDISSAQSEILSKILKEGLNAHSRGYLIQRVVQKGLILTDLKIAVLQLVIDCGCEMTTDTLMGLLKCLEDSAVTMAKNLKFGKLLLAIVNKQSKIMSMSLKTSVEIILDKHESFLKKSIKNAINKLKL